MILYFSGLLHIISDFAELILIVFKTAHQDDTVRISNFSRGALRQQEFTTSASSAVSAVNMTAKEQEEGLLLLSLLWMCMQVFSAHDNLTLSICHTHLWRGKLYRGLSYNYLISLNHTPQQQKKDQVRKTSWSIISCKVLLWKRTFNLSLL